MDTLEELNDSGLLERCLLGDGHAWSLGEEVITGVVRSKSDNAAFDPTNTNTCLESEHDIPN